MAEIIESAELIERIDRIGAQDGDVLVLRVKAMITGAAFRYLQQRWTDAVRDKYPNSLAIVVEGDLEVAVLSEKDMRRFGWVRAERSSHFRNATEGVGGVSFPEDGKS